MSNPPFDFNTINAFQSSNIPSTAHTNNTQLFKYFQRYLFQKLTAQFKWTLPDGWSDTYFISCLYGYGTLAIFNTYKYGVIPQAGALSGYDVFYQPTHILVNNPLLPPMNLRINTDCTLFRLQRDYHGALDIVNYYADLLSVACETLAINVQNSKLSYVFGVNGKTMAETGKKMFDKINSGELAVWIDKDMLREDGSPTWNVFAQNIGQNYIADKIAQNMRDLESEFCTKVGIPTCMEKKERMITAEAERNDVETDSIAAQWFDTISESAEQAKSMFGIEIKCERRYNVISSDNEQPEGQEEEQEEEQEDEKE